MSRSFLVHTALSSAAVAAILLAGCDPICTDGVSGPGQGKVTRNAAGTCVQVVVTQPDAGEDAGPGTGDAGDAGGDPDAGTDGGVCGAGPGWTAQVLDENIDSLATAFVFDAQGVGHYAYSKDAHLYVGTTRPGDAPARVENVWTTGFDVHMKLAPDGTHHVLYQYGEHVGYATDANGAWEFSYLERGWASAIALDAEGRPHVLIARPAPLVGYLYGFESATGTWSQAVLEEVGAVGDRERMTVDANGHVHFVFARMSGAQSQVVYASNVSGTWAAEPLSWWLPTGSPRLRIALEVDATGRPSLLGSDDQGAWLWVKEDSGWKSYGLGAFRSRGPALTRSALFPNIRHALLDDADPDANVNGSASRLVVKALYGTDPVATTPPLVLETLDGGNALPGPSSLQVDDQGRVQVGLSYAHYTYPAGGGLPKVTRGLSYAHYCP
ncbi:hypothetical protein KH5H1_22530 [Corallococcus caeni]|uniref:hypothetical protein n=1 Tax=Corallococcus caeni TaxID=3082388 RepID=UPI002956E90E|nr:hypothetical protein KH5H1_22530 [Corallococcus sp. KH5-1]